MLRELWLSMSAFGWHGGLQPPERKRIRLANQSALILFALILLYVPVFGFFGSALLGWVTLGVALLFLLVPLLHKLLQGAVVVRYLFLLFSYASVFIYSLILGRGTEIQLFFISVIATPFVVLDLRQPERAFLFGCLPIALLGTLELWAFEHVQPMDLSPLAQRWIYLMVLPSVSLMTFVFSGYFFIVNQQSERALHETIKDLQESKRLVEDQQLQLANASRLSAIGELSGSIAHEINNPLAIILGYTEQITRLIQFDKLDRERIAQICEKIIRTINRITKIVLGLRKLSREGGDDPMEITDLGTIIDDATSVCSESLHHAGIQLKISLPDYRCVCSCRPLQISQVLLNLIQNAKDAVQDLEEKWIAIEVRASNEDYIIQVRDSGRIHDPEILERIGQPFFTTKPAGKGTGLGLSISRRILASHGGSIEIDRKASSTTFILRLPRESEPTGHALAIPGV